MNSWRKINGSKREKRQPPQADRGALFLCCLFFPIRLFIEAAQLGEMGFDALAMGLVGWVPESQY